MAPQVGCVCHSSHPLSGFNAARMTMRGAQLSKRPAHSKYQVYRRGLKQDTATIGSRSVSYRTGTTRLGHVWPLPAECQVLTGCRPPRYRLRRQGGTAMLRKSTDKVRQCYIRAIECRERAQRERDP